MDDESVLDEGASDCEALLLLQEADLVEELELLEMWPGLEEEESGVLGQSSCGAVFGEEDVDVVGPVGFLYAVPEHIEDQRHSIVSLVHLLLFIGELLHLLLTTVREGGIKINQVHLL